MAPEAYVAAESAEVPVDDLVGPVSTAAGQGDPATERMLADVLADIVQADQVSVDSNFFDDLGADSLVMARFCARARKNADLPSVSMKDIYGHPTIRSLSAALAVAPAPAQSSAAPVEAAAPIAAAAARASVLQYVSCGVLQLMFFLGYAYLVAVVADHAYTWISAGSGFVDVYLRAVLFGGAGFVALCVVPILTKWLLVGRWKRQQIRIWSVRYVRFWIVKTLVRSNPMVLFAGTPLFALYLRALGAKVGRGVMILSPHVPVCTDLLTIGDGTVIRKDAFFACYRAQSGWIQTGAVTLGRDVFVGEKTVLDIETSMADGSQIGHASSLYSGQAVPAGERWHGSPARPTDLNYLTVAPGRCGMLRRLTFCVLNLLALFFFYLPLLEGALLLLLTAMPGIGRVLNPKSGGITSGSVYLDSLILSAVFFFGAAIIGLVVVLTVPRVLNLFIKPDKVYRMYGFHDRIHRTITRMTGGKFYTHLFGDSSYIVNYLRWLGYDLSEVEQTGSNFGTEVGHETPYMSVIGTGTMVADGLSIMNADFSSSTFRVSRVSIGPNNFVGNHIAYPVGGRTGANCLLATKVMIPLDGKVREGVGLLGSPPFEIPRSVERDGRFDSLSTGPVQQSRLAHKNRYNLRTMAMFLLSRWLHVFVITVLGLAAVDYYRGSAELEMAAFFALSILVTPVYFVLVERGLRAFRRLKPRYCSIYDPYFWRHERLWKVPGESYLSVFDGTPFKSAIWRGLGVQIGRRVFDDGCYLTERTLVAIGDDCVLNAGSKVQCHSQEDGVFKSDRTKLGAGCTLGVGAMVHYGVTMADRSELAADSFLMKGEEVPSHARWGGNPARER
jgi:non-ribosomal peptide synthetase-like protein